MNVRSPRDLVVVAQRDVQRVDQREDRERQQVEHARPEQQHDVAPALAGRDATASPSFDGGGRHCPPARPGAADAQARLPPRLRISTVRSWALAQASAASASPVSAMSNSSAQAVMISNVSGTGPAAGSWPSRTPCRETGRYGADGHEVGIVERRGAARVGLVGADLVLLPLLGREVGEHGPRRVLVLARSWGCRRPSRRGRACRPSARRRRSMSATIDVFGSKTVPPMVAHMSIIAVLPAAKPSTEAVKSYCVTRSAANFGQSIMCCRAATASAPVRFGVKSLVCGEPVISSPPRVVKRVHQSTEEQREVAGLARSSSCPRRRPCSAPRPPRPGVGIQSAAPGRPPRTGPCGRR